MKASEVQLPACQGHVGVFSSWSDTRALQLHATSSAHPKLARPECMRQPGTSTNHSRDLLQCSMPLPHNPSRPEQRQRQAQAACPYDARSAQRRPCRIGLHPARVQEKPAEETTAGGWCRENDSEASPAGESSKSAAAVAPPAPGATQLADLAKV